MRILRQERRWGGVRRPAWLKLGEPVWGGGGRGRGRRRRKGRRRGRRRTDEEGEEEEHMQDPAGLALSQSGKAMKDSK